MIKVGEKEGHQCGHSGMGKQPDTSKYVVEDVKKMSSHVPVIRVGLEWVNGGVKDGCGGGSYALVAG